jgi:CheY-like chemotaxis protein
MNEKILIVEDEMLIRDLYVQKLSKVGFQVEYAVNGQDGLEKAASFQPDLIILDILMPIMDGHTMLKHLKKQSITDKIPIIIMTNTPSLPNADEARHMGIANALFKVNVTPSQLVSHVTEFFRNHPAKS